MANHKGEAKPGEGWTEEEKGRGAPGGAGSGGQAGEAGEAKPKGKPTDDREEMEEAAAETEKEGGKERPG